MSASVSNAAQKATNFANQTVETARFEILKEPLGFIKIIQFLLAILAFATAVNGKSSLGFWVPCDAKPDPISSTTAPAKYGYTSYQGVFSYPYDLKGTQFSSTDACSNGQPRKIDRSTITDQSNNIVSSAQFFVFTGVTAMLYSLAFGVIYVFFRQKYVNMVFFSLIDFVVTCLYALFWFAGSIAWSKAVSDIQSYTNPDNIIGSFTTACQNDCNSVSSPNYANIIVSCILGFGNVILWVGDVWFVLKETTWYRTRQEAQRQSENVTNNPISANDITITATYNPNNKI